MSLERHSPSITHTTQLPHPHHNPALAASSVAPSAPPAATDDALQPPSPQASAHPTAHPAESSQTPTSTYNTDPRGSLKGADSDHTHASSPQAHNPMSASQRTHVNGAQPTPTPPKSFLSKLFRILVPCVFPSKSHPVEPADVVPAEPKELLQEKPEPTLHHEEKSSSPIATPPPQDPPREEPPQTLTAPPADTPSRPATPKPENAEIVIPPSSSKTHLLPADETEGMTSGAVQPPGSTGDSPTQEKPHLPPTLSVADGEDSDHTSYLDEEEPEDPEDEEERLIYNGGAGIPIGPVSSLAAYLAIVYSYSAIRMVCLSRCSPPSPPSTRAANA